MLVPKIIIVLLAFATYSSGVVLSRRIRGGRGVSDANATECLIVLAVLISLVVLGPGRYSAITTVLVLFGSSLFGASLGSFVRGHTKNAGTREFEEHEPVNESSVWKRWTSFGRSVADHEVRLMVIASYLVFVAPLAIAFQRRRINTSSSNLGWIARDELPDNIDAARRTY